MQHIESKNPKNIPIGKTKKWLVKHAKNAGLNLEGFNHEITSDFKNHVLKEHGDKKTETARGQIAIKESDFYNIPDIISEPDYVAIGAISKKGRAILAYAKKIGGGTSLYFEEIWDGKNKTLRSKTMYKREKDIDDDKFKNIVSNNGKTNLKSAIILKNLRDTGGEPGLTMIQEPSGGRHLTQPVNLNNTSHDTENKSSENKKKI